MRLADAEECLRAMAWLALCSLLLAFPACTGVQSRIEPARAEHGLIPAAQKGRPQRVARHNRPTARTARAVPPIIVMGADADGTDADEKERLFRGFVEWQGAQDAAR